MPASFGRDFVRSSRPVGAPTPYADLNRVLSLFVAGLETVLGKNLCGAYLQGSFAVGDADEYSDVDFIVVAHDDLSEPERAGLQRLHARLYRRAESWAQHLEGSYITVERLRRVDCSRAPLFYLDNGAQELVWDKHCNTAVVRWSLRERGIVLTGPHPRELIEPVAPDVLRADVREAMREWSHWARDSYARFERGELLAFSRWKQQLLVLSHCRMLHTVQTGRVASKRASGEWALNALEDRWSALIQTALEDRPDPWARVREAADAEAVRATMNFLDATAPLVQPP
jgi:predicted nucleotidyltransferase